MARRSVSPEHLFGSPRPGTVAVADYRLPDAQTDELFFLRPVSAIVFGTHALSARGVREVLESGAIRVLASTIDPGLLLTTTEAQTPDVAFFDLYTSVGEHFRLLTEVKRASYSTKIVVLVETPTMDDLRTALRGGVTGFLVKGRGPLRPEPLEKVVREVAFGGAVIEAKLLAKLLHTLPMDTLGPANDQSERLFRLDEFDRCLLTSLAHGASVREFADSANFTPGAVRNRLTAIYRILGVSNRAEAVAVAVRCGLAD